LRKELLVATAFVALSSFDYIGSAIAAPLSEDAKAFGTREAVSAMSMSPDGTKAAILVGAPGSTTILRIADFNTGGVASLTNSDGRPQSLRWCRFAGNNHLVCQYTGIDQVGGVLVEFSRLIALSVDGKSMKTLGQGASDKDAYIRQHDGAIVDWLPQNDGQVLMARSYVPEINTTGSLLGRRLEGLGVDRVDLASMKSSSIETPRPQADSYMSDGAGRIRLYSTSEAQGESGLLTGKIAIKYRTIGSKDWRNLGIYDSRTDQGYWPLAIDGESDSLFALKDVAGRDTLVRVKLDGTAAEAAIASNPNVDIDGIVRLGAGNRVIGYTYADDRRHHVYFDREYDTLQKSLSKAIPAMPLIDFLGASSDGTKLLVYASGDTAPGTFYRFDKSNRKLEEIAAVRPLLSGRLLSPVKSIRISASDGAQIPAYLTIPAGSSGKNLPAVVLPHGGPSARDEWGFDWLAQFLAARGYVVIQPNYRGSAGYGSEWMGKNGFQGWRTSIGDVSSAARYLVSQGIADPKRMAIVGWSYGGYAALQSVVAEPSLYKAAVAIAPVTDLALLKRQYDQYTDKRLAQAFIGAGPHIVEGSPLQNVQEIGVPVLLVHADRDLNVAFAQSQKMDTALRAAGREVEFLKFKGLDHQLDDSGARTEMLTRIGALLERTIGL
jgi:acetyl esterase/lipase